MSEAKVQLGRLPVISPEARTREQEDAVAKLAATPRGGVRGPFQALLYSPELLNRTQSLGAFLRYDCSLSQRIREFAILVTARFWNQGYEWGMHAPIAKQAGVAEAVIEAIAKQQPLPETDRETETVYQFCDSLHRRHFVPDEVYRAAVECFGENGVVELSALCGYYALLAMVMNVARTPLPAGTDAPFSLPEQIP